MNTLRTSMTIGVGLLVAALRSSAAPYASGISNNSGTISYYLNSTPASGMLTVTTYPSGAHPSLTPATPVQGLNSFSLGSDTSYAISVSQIGTGTPAAETIAAANTPQTTWGGSPDGRGMDVNAYPANGAAFGTVYLANSAAGGTGAQAKGKGLFPCHSDMSLAFGATTAGLDSSTFSASGTSGPYKIGVSRADGSVFVGDLSAAASGVWMFSPTLTTPTLVLGPLGNTASPTTVHGSIYGHPTTTGSYAAGNLVLYTFDDTLPTPASVQSWFGGLQGGIGVGAAFYDSTYEYSAGNPSGPITSPSDYNMLYRYTINSSTLPYEQTPDLGIGLGLNYNGGAGGIPGDSEVGADGKLFVASERSAATDAPWLAVYDSTGQTNLFNSMTASGTDLIYNQLTAATGSSVYDNGCLVRVSPDGKYVALGLYYDRIVVYALTNGIPDLSTFTYISAGVITSAARGLGWDAADNVYYFNSGTGNLSIFDLGLTTTCVTSNDYTTTNGSFSLQTPNVTASATVTAPMAYQANNSSQGFNASPIPATFNITLNAPQSGATVVKFTLTGTASNTVNYTSSAGTSNAVTFPAGVTNETVTITPTATPVSGPTLSVILTVVGSSSYSATAPSTGTAYIANSGPQEITVGAITYPTMYRGTPQDYVSFQLVRYGDTNVAFTVPASSFTYSGTAVEGTDYTLTIPASYIPAGAASIQVTNGYPVSSAYPFTYVGNESVIVTIAGGTSPESIPFTAVSPTTATMTLLDNANPPESVIWSDALTNAADTGWNLVFGSVATPTTVVSNYLTVSGSGATTNTDYDVEFGYPISLDPLIGSLPPNGAASALKVTVNKNAVTYTNNSGTVTAGATGGVSLYPALAGGVPMSFSGNFALRFSEMSYEDTGSSATESTDFGINHYGTNANWWAGNFAGGFGNSDIDGLWYSMTCDQGGASYGDVLEFSSTNLPNAGWVNLGNQSWSGYGAVFKHPPYNSSGSSFAEGYGNQGFLWNDVEVKQFNNVVTCSINKTPIFTYTNTGVFKAGDIMLGYCDPFDSVGTYGEAYFSNVRVVSLAGPTIIGESVSGTNVTIQFTTPDTDASPASFSVLSATNVVGPITNATTATITQSGDIYTAVTGVATNSTQKYYIIKQSNIIQ